MFPLNATESFLAFPLECLSPLDNMALDSYLLRHDTHNYIRFYTWTEPCISYGPQTDLSQFDRSQWPDLTFVRRETGGGALQHGSDISFSFIFSTPTGGPKSVFERVNDLVRQSLINLDLPLDASSCGDRVESFSNICYNRTHRYEISIKGQKLVCLAQKATRQRFLLQGSISLEPPDPRMGQVFRNSLDLPRIVHINQFMGQMAFMGKWPKSVQILLENKECVSTQAILDQASYQDYRAYYAIGRKKS